MALSKSTRILILLVIDVCFFLLELIVGYAVHSLALVADSFHMLNDVLSLCVGLWAVQVANKGTNNKVYTYGWQRAETLGALVNGVFLVALCVTIFLDAIQRFVEPQIVTNPKLVLIVGCMGLASNIIGLFLFHEHGHSHGGHGEGHSHGDEVHAAEEGHSHSRETHEEAREAQAADESGNVADVLPQNKIGNWPQTDPNVMSPTKSRERRRSRAYSNIDDIHVTPSAFRRSIIDASRVSESDDDMNIEDAIQEEGGSGDANGSSGQPLLNGNGQANGYGSISHRKSIDHKSHNHRQPQDGKSGGHGHSHGDLNMKGIFLHVMGDALGNVGVIATALVIWLTNYSWRYYFDPAISLVITIIILASAIPLCKAASRILLQAVPLGINIDHIKEDIQDLPGIVSCHHVHVWQLSDTKLVASLHVQVEFDFKDEGSARYMQLAQAIRRCLHEYGIHSSTIQPEFCLDPAHDHRLSATDGAVDSETSPRGPSKAASKAASVCEPDACLLECGDDCGAGKTCCGGKGAKKGATESCGHDHGH